MKMQKEILMKTNRYKIKPEERGHRKPLSDEPTVLYNIKMPESLKEKCIKKGASWVRKTIQEKLQSIKPTQEQS